MIMIHSYENGKRAESCIEYLGRLERDDRLRIVLLPIPTTRDGKTILNTKVYINEVLDEIIGDTVVCGYGLTDSFCEAVRSRGGRVLDLLHDEDFLVENAELTALCTVGILLTTTEYAPKDVTVGVVGYGRIGKRLTNMLLYLGANVRVYTTRESTRTDLGECGVASSKSCCDADMSDIDLLINTAPAAIFSAEKIPHGLRVIDLASGENFAGLTVEKYPSVPAKMLPKSAGRVWGRAVERFISAACSNA